MNRLKQYKFLFGLGLILLCVKAISTPVYFVADSVIYSTKEHKIIYTGHVKVDQGNTHITGDELTLLLTATNQVITMIDIGKPATYSTIQENHPGVIHTHADRIVDDRIKKIVTLTGHASVEQNHNTISAAVITYNQETGTVYTHGDDKDQMTHITVMPTANSK